MSVTPAFDKVRALGRSALVGYLPAGFPTVADSISAINTMIDAGCDIIEVGLPYSDPVMDGHAIQTAAATALSNGCRTREVLSVVESVAGRGVPILVMTYWNPIEKYGVGEFARDFAAAGGAGLITPDLIPEEAEAWLAASDDHDLDRVFLVAPSSTKERIALTVEATRGFVYAQSIMGITGARDTTSAAAPELVRRARRVTDLPIGVGLGVRNGEQAAAVASYGDAVIVGSAMVSSLLEAASVKEGLARLRELTHQLADGVSQGGK